MQLGTKATRTILSFPPVWESSVCNIPSCVSQQTFTSNGVTLLTGRWTYRQHLPYNTWYSEKLQCFRAVKYKTTSVSSSNTFTPSGKTQRVELNLHPNVVLTWAFCFFHALIKHLEKRTSLNLPLKINTGVLQLGFFSDKQTYCDRWRGVVI